MSYPRSSAAIHVLAFFSNLAHWRVILLRLLRERSASPNRSSCRLRLTPGRNQGLAPAVESLHAHFEGRCVHHHRLVSDFIARQEVETGMFDHLDQFLRHAVPAPGLGTPAELL